MKLNKTIVAAVTLLLVSGSVMAGMMYKRMSSPEKVADFVVEEVSEELNLTEAQLVSLNKVKDVLLGMHEDMHGDRETHKSRILSLIDQPVLDQATALTMFKQKSDYLNDKAPEVIAALGEFYDGLNAEQQAVLKQRIEEHKSHRHMFSH